MSKQDVTIPNIISAIRLLLIPVFAVLVATHHDLAALVVVAISSVSDWADGFIARRFNQVSELGKALDPIADRCFIFAALLALVIRDEVPLLLFLLVLLRDLLMVGLVSAIARSGHEPLAVTYIGKAATLCILVALPLFILSTLIGGNDAVTDAVRWLAWVFAVPGVVLYWVAAFQYFMAGRKLLRTSARAEGDQND